MEERGGGEVCKFAINEGKDASVGKGDYLHEGEVGVFGIYKKWQNCTELIEVQMR